MEEGIHQQEGGETKDLQANLTSWQNAIAEYCGKQYNTPTGHAYPNGVAYFLHTLQNQAEQAGNRETASSLAALNDTYGLIAFPFLSFESQRAYSRAFSERGWLQQDSTEAIPAVELSDEEYGSLTQLLDKANIPEMYKLTQRGDIPHQTTAEGKYAISIAPLLADLKRNNEFFRAIARAENKKEEGQSPIDQKKSLPRMRLVKPLSGAHIIRSGFSADSNREKR